MLKEKQSAQNATQLTLRGLLGCLPLEVGALVARQNGEIQDKIRHNMNLNTRHKFGDTKHCKVHGYERPVYHFTESTNSDDGLFPICRTCVARLEYLHEKKYNHYFSK